MPPKKRQSTARGTGGGRGAKRARLAASDEAAPAAREADDASGSEDSPAKEAPAEAVGKGSIKRLQGRGKAPAAKAGNKAKKVAAVAEAAAASDGASDESDAGAVGTAGRGRPGKGKTPAAKKAKAVAAAAAADTGSTPAAPVAASELPESAAKDAAGRPWRLKLASWNINGLRAWLKANGTRYMTEEAPFVIGVQEIKCPADKVPPEAQVPGYHAVFSSADKGGYAGTGIYCREKPLSVQEGIGAAKHDTEGRVITAEFPEFYFVTAYVPNSGRELARLKYRTTEWDRDFAAHLRRLDAMKPVVVCGDLNVAHSELDLANPKGNQRTAGFTKEERDSFSAMLAELGLVDTFRQAHPDQAGAYTFWSYMRNARAKNIGWRLDYFLVSRRLADRVCDSLIRPSVPGSDHCPIVLLLSL